MRTTLLEGIRGSCCQSELTRPGRSSQVGYGLLRVLGTEGNVGRLTKPVQLILDEKAIPLVWVDQPLQ